MIKFYQTKEFKALEVLWERRLSKSGFVDAEKSLRADRALKQRSSNAYRQMSALNREIKAVYFQKICDHVLTTAFKNSTDEKIMTLFSEGKKRTQIAFILKPKSRRFRETVGLIIRRYEHIWGLRRWSAKERGLKNG